MHPDKVKPHVDLLVRNFVLGINEIKKYKIKDDTKQKMI